MQKLKLSGMKEDLKRLESVKVNREELQSEIRKHELEIVRFVTQSLKDYRRET